MSILWFRSLLIASLILLLFVQGVYGSKDSNILAKESTKYIYPQENQTVFYKNITLTWHTENYNLPVLLQVSENKEFTKVVIEATVHGHSFTSKNLSKCKEYYWKISTPDSQSENHYSFFKTSTLQIDYHTPCCLQLIPTSIDGLPLLYIDNPDFKQYTISIHNIDNFEKVIEKKSSSEYQCIPAYKLPDGRYMIKIEVPGEQKNNISEIIMIKEK